MVDNIKEDGEGAVPVNAMGSSSSTTGTGGIDIYDPLMKKKKSLRDVVKRKSLEDIRNGTNK